MLGDISSYTATKKSEGKQSILYSILFYMKHDKLYHEIKVDRTFKDEVQN